LLLFPDIFSRIVHKHKGAQFLQSPVSEKTIMNLPE
jgi:hypothetical protein